MVVFMMKEKEIQDLLEWGKEEKQSDFVELVQFFRDRRADKKNIIVDYDGKKIEGYLNSYSFRYKKPFPDFDFSFWIGDEEISVILPYTYMEMVKKVDKNEFVVETEKGKEAVICFEEAE